MLKLARIQDHGDAREPRKALHDGHRADIVRRTNNPEIQLGVSSRNMIRQQLLVASKLALSPAASSTTLLARG